MLTITVPATTANLGPGFDCLGAALTLYNQFQFTKLPDSGEAVKISASGSEAERVSTDSSNLLYRAFVEYYRHLGQAPPPAAIHIQLGVPLARGLGSSATAIVGGLMAANQLAGKPLERSQLLELAIALEGHPDNVVPALLGNCQLSVSEGNKWQICEIPWQPTVVPVLAIPNFELSTAEARAVLPQAISRSDAIFNSAHLGLLLRGLETGRGEWLQVAMADKLHQPYRQPLIPGYEAVRAAALAAGAYGMVISGAGPTLLALAPAPQADEVADAMQAAWQEAGILAEARSLSLDTNGAIVNE